MCFAFLEGEVAGFDDFCKKDVFQGVFMGAINARIVRQGGKFPQRDEHLRGCTFKKLAAAAGEQRIATKQGICAIISDVACGVAGYVEHLERRAQFRQLHRIAFTHGMRDGGNVFSPGAENRYLAVPQQGGVSAGMVAVVVSVQDGRQQQVMAAEIIQYRFGIAGVHSGGVAPIADQPDVVVFESRDRNDFHGGMVVLTQHDVNGHEWFETPLGRYLIERELAFFDQAVADIFGFNALQVGFVRHELLRTNRMPKKFSVAPEFPAGLGGAIKLRAEPAGLPLASQSIDLLLLPHVLEFSDHPHQILREAERVLMPEGQVIISGFNPFSLWGLPRLLPGCKHDYPWHGNFISLPRIKDWLSLLGFEVVAGRMCCYAPPLRREQWLRRFRFMEAAGDRWWALAGGVYFLQAKKRVAGMHLIMPSWNKSPAAKKALAPVPQKMVNNKISQ